LKIEPLDKLVSEYVRRRAIERIGGCERCLSGKTDYKQLQCSHFHGRAKKSTRHDEDNLAGLCAGCHMYLTAHPLEHVEWFKNHLGQEAFDLLNSRMRIPGKPDKAALILYFKEKLKEVE